MIFDVSVVVVIPKEMIVIGQISRFQLKKALGVSWLSAHFFRPHASHMCNKNHCKSAVF